MSTGTKYDLTEDSDNQIIVKPRKGASSIFLVLVVVFCYVCLIPSTQWSTGTEITVSLLQFALLTALMIIVGFIPALISVFFREVVVNKSGVSVLDTDNKLIFRLFYPTRSHFETNTIDRIVLIKEMIKKQNKEKVYISVQLSLKSSVSIPLFRFKGPFTRKDKIEASMLSEKIGKVLNINVENNLQQGL